MANDTRIWTDVRFRQRRQADRMPAAAVSSHRSAYGTIPIPIVCIKNGLGRPPCLSPAIM